MVARQETAERSKGVIFLGGTTLKSTRLQSPPKSRGLEEGFNSEWELAELTAAYEEAINASPANIVAMLKASTEFERLFKQQIQKRKNELMSRVQSLTKKYNHGYNLSKTEADEFRRGIGLLKGSGVPIVGADDIAAIPFAEEEDRIRQSLAAERPDLLRDINTSEPIDSNLKSLAKTLTRTYALLRADAAVQAALKTVGGTLAEPPEISNKTKTAAEEPEQSLSKSDASGRAMKKRATRTAEESKPQQAEQQTSPGETAEEFLQSKGLVEGFNSTWKLENDLTKNLQQIRSSSGRIGVAAGPQYRSELKRRVVTKKTEIINRWLQLQRQPSDNGGPRDQEFAVLESWIYPTGLGPKVKDDIAVIQAIHREVNAEFKARAAANPLVAGLIADIRRAYASLAGDSRVQAALKTVGGTLAEPPAAAANLSSEKFTGSYEKLAEQLTALEKETKKTLGAFNTEAKAYISNKKNLVKRIKAGEKLYAQRGRQQEAIEYPEEKIKFGQETEATVVKPLNAFKAQLKNLAKPDMAPLEENLKQAEKLIEQLKTTSEYAESPKSVDSLAAAIAKYRKGFEVQQTKMAK